VGSGSPTSTSSHPTSTDSGNSTGPAGGKSHSHTGVALGATFGALALIATGLAAAYFVKRRDGRLDRFRAIGGEEGLDGDGNESVPNIGGTAPTAGLMQEKRSGWLPRSSLPTLGLGLGILGGGRNARTAQERRDMLADEDTRQFGLASFHGTADGSAGSSWSLRSVGAMMRGIRSREASVSSTPRAGTPWQEKTDPFSDGTALMRDEEVGLVGASPSHSVRMAGAEVTRMQDRREASYSSVLSARSYHDPFKDPILEEPGLPRGEGGEPNESIRLANYRPAPPPPIQTMFPLSTNVHTLTPLAEGASINTLTSPSLSSDEQVLTLFDSSSRGASSFTSLETPKVSARPHSFRSSIIDANTPPTQPMSRSNSWWARFSRTPFLDRRASDAKPHSRILDIRDPNPPPRLLAIEESAQSLPPDSPQSQNFRSGSGSDSQKVRQNSRLYHSGHGKSASSLQTTKTADSEAIEKLGGTMVVVQRDASGGASTSSAGGRATPDGLTSQVTLFTDEQGSLTFTSPKEMTPTESPSSMSRSVSASQSRITSAAEGPSLGRRSSADSPLVSGKRPALRGAVAARIQAYERRMSQDSPPLSPDTRNTKHKEARTKKVVTINYGLAPRQSLFVANPDHGNS
jgi:hypothetical protein